MYCDEIVISDAIMRTVNLEMTLLSTFVVIQNLVGKKKVGKK